MSLLYNLADVPSLAVIPLLWEKLWVVAPPDAGLTPESAMPWESVLAHPLVLPVTGHGLRALIDQARSSVATRPHIAIQTNSMHLQKKLVLAGHGWTVLPAAGVAGDIAAGVLSGAPLTAPEVVRSVVLGLQRGEPYADASGSRRGRAHPPGPSARAFRSMAVRPGKRASLLTEKQPPGATRTGAHERRSGIRPSSLSEKNSRA